MQTKSIIDFLHYILGMMFNLVIVIAIGVAVYFFAILGFNWGAGLAYDIVYTPEYYEIVLVLQEDTPAREVSRMLEEMGVINNSRLFNIELFLMGRVRTYAAGTYVLNRNMSNTDVHIVMRGTAQGQAPHETIRIPEGWTILEMADYFESRGFFPAEEFINVATYGHFNLPFLFDRPLRPGGLEGYLFPDTYQIPVNPSPGDIIIRMLSRFEAVFTDEMYNQAYEMGLTMDDVIIMASIVEKETRVAAERPMVSQVIHNRLAINMNLQMCSTVQYVLSGMGIHRDRLLYIDLELDSPYNTYLHPGLPIGPISNPGLAAIQAVLNPTPHDYLFFVLYDFEYGSHFFSRTVEEHNAADARARTRQ